MAKRLLYVQHQVLLLQRTFSVSAGRAQCNTIFKLAQSPECTFSRIFSNKHSDRVLSPTATTLNYGLGDCSKRHMAGHSKWQNIRHIKAAKDAQKQNIASQVVNRIKVAIREGGSSNPEFNYKLAQVLRYGASHNIPKNTLEKAVKDYSKSQQAGSQVFVECRGPSNTFLIVEAFTDKHKWCRQEITRVLKKYGGAIGNKGFAAHSFDNKGIIKVGLKEGEALDMDAATDAAIEAGAEDVTSTVDENDTRILEYICDHTELHKVKKNLEETGATVSEARLGYVPKIYNPLSPEELEILSKALDELESMDFVMRVYDNAEQKG